MATTPEPCAPFELVRAHPSFIVPPFDASMRKLTPEEIQWYKERGCNVDEDGDVLEPEGGLVSCGVGRFHPNADVIAREKREAKAMAAALIQRAAPAPPAAEEEEDYEAFVARCVAAAVAADSCLVGVSMWGARYPFGTPDAPDPPWAKDPSWPLGNTAAVAKKRKHRAYSDGGYRISKRSSEAARTELVVANALRYAEDLQKKEAFAKCTLGLEGSRLQLERDLANQPPMTTRGRARRVHFRV